MPVKDRPHDRSSTSRRTFEDGDDSDWPPRPSPERETEEQRTERLEREREAKRVSDDIDSELEAEKIERRKRKPDVKILLLGEFLRCLFFSALWFSSGYGGYTAADGVVASLGRKLLACGVCCAGSSVRLD